MVRYEPWRCRDESAAQTQQLCAWRVKELSPHPSASAIGCRRIDGVNRPEYMGEWPERERRSKWPLRHGREEHEGLALPAAGPKLVSLKLTNGYNVSYPDSYVESVEILDEVKISEQEPLTPIEQDENLPLVHLIHTGGTIASKVDYATGAVTARFEPDELLQSVPELRSVARLRVVKLEICSR